MVVFFRRGGTALRHCSATRGAGSLAKVNSAAASTTCNCYKLLTNTHKINSNESLSLRFNSTTLTRRFSSSSSSESPTSDSAAESPKKSSGKTVTKTFDLDGNEIPDSDSASDIEVPPELLEKIRKLINSNPAVLFMKGNPDDPLCGFSAKMVHILEDNDFDDYTFVDVSKSDEVREGVKKLTYWPTIPQFFVKGEFVGGFDIVESMHRDGELGGVLEKAREKKAPSEDDSEGGK